jgi:hypothetical protein
MAKKPMTKKPMKDKKEMMDKKPSSGLTAAQKKLPPALQAAIMKKMKNKKK